MKLHAYGCSWTQGESSDLEYEKSLPTIEEKIEFRKNNSWPKHIGDMLGVDHINNGICGNSNNNIFNKIVSDVQWGVIKENDLAMIMWSSSLRDVVPFLPNSEWVSWSVKHLMESPQKFINSYKIENQKYDDFLGEFKSLFITEMFNQNYYNIVNQNYIIFIQKLLESHNIKYIMCDSFEPMLIDLNKKDDITHIIDNTNYWGYRKQIFRDFLIDTNRLDIWEHQDVTFKTRATQHPNKHGYKLIADELYKFILQVI